MSISSRNQLGVWKNVIFALFLREIKSRFNDKFGISWAIVSPLAFIVMFSYLRGILNGGITHSIPTLIFMLIGLILIKLFTSTTGSVSMAIVKNKSLFAFRQVQPLSAILAIAIFEWLVVLLICLIITGIIFFIEFDFVFYDWLFVIVIFLSVWLLAISMGMVFAIINCFLPEFNKIKSLLMKPVFFISCVFFSLKDIPQDFWVFLNWNPLVHAIELTRFCAYPIYGKEGVDFNFFFICVYSCFSIALLIYAVYWKKAISR